MVAERAGPETIAWGLLEKGGIEDDANDIGGLGEGGGGGGADIPRKEYAADGVDAEKVEPLPPEADPLPS